MKTICGYILVAVFAASFASTRLPAEESAVVKGDNVNVRGKPSLAGEVVTQIKKGEKVILLEEIAVAKPKADEPAKWAKIQMPANTPVWVNATFLDSNNVVKPPKLNLRAGPGENYSVVGRIEQGAAVKPIRNVESWVEIEGSTNAYAFVAADLLTKTSPAEPLLAEKKPEPKPEEIKPAKTEEVKPVVVPPVAPPPVEKIAEAPKVAAPVDTAPPMPAPKPEAAAPVAVTAPPSVLTPPPVAKPAPKAEEPAPRRVVTREGVVRGAVSIQAPTYFELTSAETGKLLNYLHPMSTNIVLKKLRGKKVIVTGEESMDARWVSTPVIRIQTLQIAP